MDGLRSTHPTSYFRRTSTSYEVFEKACRGWMSGIELIRSAFSWKMRNLLPYLSRAIETYFALLLKNISHFSEIRRILEYSWRAEDDW